MNIDFISSHQPHNRILAECQFYCFKVSSKHSHSTIFSEPSLSTLRLSKSPSICRITFSCPTIDI